MMVQESAKSSLVGPNEMSIRHPFIGVDHVTSAAGLVGKKFFNARTAQSAPIRLSRHDSTEFLWYPNGTVIATLMPNVRAALKLNTSAATYHNSAPFLQAGPGKFDGLGSK